METELGTRMNTWHAALRTNSLATVRLFCFPYSGAGASIYYRWLEKLPGNIEISPVQLPGRETRLSEKPYTNLQSLVRAIAGDLIDYLDKPFAFFGHSMGALLSFELARHLRRLYGVSPIHLFVSGHVAPQIRDRREPIYPLSEPEFIAEVRRLNGTPQEVFENVELRQLFLPILRADFEICETYVYQDEMPLECPITAFGGLLDSQVSRHSLEAWRQQTTASFRLHMLPGDHFFLNSGRLQLLSSLARALAGLE